MLRNKLSHVAFSYTALMDVGCQLLKYVRLDEFNLLDQVQGDGNSFPRLGSRICIMAECVQLK